MSTEIRAPRLNANDEKLEIVRWLVSEASYVEAGQELIEVETAKATSVVHAEESGFLIPRCQPGDVVRVNEVMALLGKDQAEATAALSTVGPNKGGQRPGESDHLTAFRGEPLVGRGSPGAVTGMPATTRSDAFEGAYGFTEFSKKAAQILKEENLDPAQFKGLGLVTSRVLRRRLNPDRPQRDALAVAGSSGPAVIPANQTAGYEQQVAGWTNQERIPLAKQREIDLLTAGQSGLINSSLTIKLPTAGIKEALKAHTQIGGNVTALALYEMARLVRKYPKFNSFFAHNQICFYDRVNLGLAIDLDKGLKVGVIHDADQMPLHDIASRVGDLAIGYVGNTLTGDDLMGGTITITDLSGDGIVHFQPLLNKDQAVIIGIGGEPELPDAPVTITVVFDHRVLTGREVSTFLGELKEQLLSFATENLPATKRDLRLDSCSCHRCRITLRTLEEQPERRGFLLQIASQATQPSYICNVCAAGY